MDIDEVTKGLDPVHHNSSSGSGAHHFESSASQMTTEQSLKSPNIERLKEKKNNRKDGEDIGDFQEAAEVKKRKTDANLVNDARSMSKLFPKIDNLEYFPLEILVQIFSLVDDMELLNLAENSIRFGEAAKIVLSERYTNDYFKIDEFKNSLEIYKNWIQHFGNDIKAIETKENDWTALLLQRTNNLKKLKLELPSLNEQNESILHRFAASSITHLTLRVAKCTTENRLNLSKFHKLKELILNDEPCVTFASLRELIVNNPGLESLHVVNTKTENDVYDRHIVELYPFDELMKTIIEVAQVNQFKEFSYILQKFWHYSGGEYEQPPIIVDAFVDSMKHLESLALTPAVVDLFTDADYMLERLASHCEHLKELKLFELEFTGVEIFEEIESFQSIENLHLGIRNFDYESIESVIQNLPLLRQLRIELYDNYTDLWFALKLLFQCASLEKLTISFDKYENCNFEIFGTAKFFEKFIDCIKMRNVEIDIKLYDWRKGDQLIGTISKNQVIWRNKLLHWVGYDPSRNSSQVNLMDLTNQTTTGPTATEQKQIENHPFDLILSYLDLSSLHSLSRANRKCLQQVESFVKEHSRKHRAFTITDEFFTGSNVDYKKLDNFAEHINNLRVNIYYWYIQELKDIIGQFQNLNKLHIYTISKCERFDELIVPCVRHFIFEGTHAVDWVIFTNLPFLCPDIETIELRNLRLYFFPVVKGIGFHQFLKFFEKLYDYDDQQLQKLQTLFVRLPPYHVYPEHSDVKFSLCEKPNVKPKSLWNQRYLALGVENA